MLCSKFLNQFFFSVTYPSPGNMRVKAGHDCDRLRTCLWIKGFNIVMYFYWQLFSYHLTKGSPFIVMSQSQSWHRVPVLVWLNASYSKDQVRHLCLCCRCPGVLEVLGPPLYIG